MILKKNDKSTISKIIISRRSLEGFGELGLPNWPKSKKSEMSTTWFLFFSRATKKENYSLKKLPKKITSSSYCFTNTIVDTIMLYFFSLFFFSFDIIQIFMCIYGMVSCLYSICPRNFLSLQPKKKKYNVVYLTFLYVMKEN